MVTRGGTDLHPGANSAHGSNQLRARPRKSIMGPTLDEGVEAQNIAFRLHVVVANRLKTSYIAEINDETNVGRGGRGGWRLKIWHFQDCRRCNLVENLADIQLQVWLIRLMV